MEAASEVNLTLVQHIWTLLSLSMSIIWETVYNILVADGDEA